MLAHFGRECICVSGTTDEGIPAWGFEWWPHALTHFLNPLDPKILYSPEGINLAHGTLMPALGLALWPLTALTSPLFSFNVAATLAPALTALTAFLLCRRLTGAFLPSLVGGWLFGFSAYMLGQETGHLNLTLVFLVPTIVHLGVNAYTGASSGRRAVVLLAAALIVQFLLSLEVWATLTVFLALAIVVSWVMGDAEARDRLRHLIRVLAWAYLITIVLMSPYLYYALSPGGEPILTARTTKYSADLLGFVIPTQILRLGGLHFLATTEKFTAGYVEGAAYLGVPILALCAISLWRLRRRWEVRLLAVMLVVTAVCSLGAYLHVDGHRLLPLPWDLAAHLPLLGVALPSRLTMYVTLITSVLVAWGLADGAGVPWARLALALAGIVSLWPNLGYTLWRSTPELPPLFTSAAYRHVLRPSDRVLTLPVGIYGNDMLWQAEDDLRFTMVGGYVVPPEAPDPYRSSAVYPTLYYDATVPHEQRAAEQFLTSHRVTVAVMTVAFAKLSPWPRILYGLGWRGGVVGGAVVIRPPAASLVR